MFQKDTPLPSYSSISRNTDGSTSTSPELEQALTALRKVDAITSVRTVELGKL